jgi:hypothetical protein
MARYINISDEKKRDALVSYVGSTVKPKVRNVLGDGSQPVTRRVVKADATSSDASLLKRFGSLGALGAALIESDPEINIEVDGQFAENTTRVFLNASGEIARKVAFREIVYQADGTIKEEREVKKLGATVQDTEPLRWTGKMLPIKDAISKFIFSRKYQVRHVNGLTFDFLFDMAKTLHDKQSLMLIGSGAKGLGPLVFEEGGKPYRGFLQGMVEGNAYSLVLHLSNLELKPLPSRSEAA